MEEKSHPHNHKNMKAAPYINDVKTTPGIHPILRKVLPERIVNIYHDQTIGQYVMMFLYTAVAIGVVFSAAVFFMRWFL